MTKFKFIVVDLLKSERVDLQVAKQYRSVRRGEPAFMVGIDAFVAAKWTGGWTLHQHRIVTPERGFEYCHHAWFKHPTLGTLALYTACHASPQLVAESDSAWEHFDCVNGSVLNPFDMWDW